MELKLQENERRILAHLGEPRSLPNLTRVLCADRFAPFDVDDGGFDKVREEVETLVTALTKVGLIAAVGSHAEGKSAVRAIASNSDAIDLPKSKADALRRRLDSGLDGRLDTGPLIVLSKQGLAALTA